MTRPTPTQGAQSEAARVPRVSDAYIQYICERANPQNHNDNAYLDLRDERQASRDKDATIADLERRLAEAAERISDMIATGLRAQVEAHEAVARADALQARLTEAEQRAATAERRGFEAGRDAAARFLADHFKRWGGYVHLADDVRALAPAVPQEGETTP